jgi:hypothetical protein
LRDAELIHDHYRLLKSQIEDISLLGSRIYLECRFFDTYRLVRDNLSGMSDSRLLITGIYDSIDC